MGNIRLGDAEHQGLAKKPYSAGLGLIALSSRVISMLSAWSLAYDFLGYHVPDRPPHPEISVLALVLGLSIAAVGQRLGSGRNEGIKSREWVGIIDVLLIRLAFAGLVFVASVLQYAMRGRPIHLYPVGLLTIVSGFFLVARLIAKRIFHIDSVRTH